MITRSSFIKNHQLDDDYILTQKNNKQINKSQSQLKNHTFIFVNNDSIRLFPQFQLVESRFSSLKEYLYFIDEFKKINEELIEYVNKKKLIKNFTTTYYFYQNAYNRIRHINNLCQNQQSAKMSLVKLIQWFNQQKPKIRGLIIKKIQPSLKLLKQTYQQKQQLQSITQNSIRKRQLKPYETMSRTVHKNFFPPKQRLLQYEKRQFKKNNDLLRKKSLSMFGQTSDNFNSKKRSLAATMSTLKTSKNTFVKSNQANTNRSNNDNKKSQFENLIENNEFDINEFNLQNLQNQQDDTKKLNKHENIQSLIAIPQFEEDNNDEQQQQQQGQLKQKTKKIYLHDYLASQEKQTQNKKSKISIPQQSNLRRLLKAKQSQIVHKIQDMKIKQHMNKWARSKSFLNQQIRRRSQSFNFYKTQFVKKGFISQNKQTQQFDFKFTQKTTTQNSNKVKINIENKKINDAIRMFGRHISSHVNINKNDDNDNEENQSKIKMMRATSLTFFNKNNNKSKQFNQLLQRNNINDYNNNIANDVVHLKEKLSKKMISINSHRAFSGLSAVKQQTNLALNVFPKTVGLLSNPFFPKHLYESKKKKK